MNLAKRSHEDLIQKSSLSNNSTFLKLALAAFNSLPLGKGWGWAALLIINCTLSIVNSQAQTYMNIHLSDGSVTQIDISTIDSITYSVTNPGVLATITTTGVTGISGPSALSGGNITADGGSTITSRGICWSTSPNPTTADDTTLNGTGIGSFTDYLTGLSANTTFYVRAYAINSAGTAYGNQQTFTTGNIFTAGAGVTDIDGNVYPSVIIGTQEWMQQNLRVTHYANGDSINYLPFFPVWSTTSDTNHHWCWYADSSELDIPYGKYYNWYTATDYRNLCPAGWHLPAESDWATLVEYLDPNFPAGTSHVDVGLALTETGNTHWNYNGFLNLYATNSSGFTALPTGSDGGSNLGICAYWWSSNLAFGENLFYLTTGYDVTLTHGITEAYLFGVSVPSRGASIRCLKD